MAITGTGIRFDGVAQGPRGPIPNATITVCGPTATGIPCSPIASTFTDATLVTACGAGLQVVLTNTSTCVATGDGLGNFGFWVPPGDYIYTISGPSITGQSFAITLPAGAPGILFVDGIRFAKNDTGIQAALSQCTTNGGGVVYLTDASLGAYSALTQTMVVTDHCVLMVGNMGTGNTTGLVSSASPVINLNCSFANCGASVVGIARGGSRITASGAGANGINVAANCNFCRVENLSIGGSGTSNNSVQIQDNQRELTFRNVTLNPIATCMHYVPGASGFNFIELDQVTCTPGTGNGFDFNLGGFTGGTNLNMIQVFCNAPGTTPICFDLSAVQAQLISCSANSDQIGIRTGNNPGPIHIIGCQFQADTTAGIQVNGTSAVVIDTPQHQSDQIAIQVQASGDTSIRLPITNGTVGANSIVYTAAATGFNELISTARLDKAISVSTGSLVHQRTLGFMTLPGALGVNTALTAGHAADFNSGTTDMVIGGQRSSGNNDVTFGVEGGGGNVSGAGVGDFFVRGITNGISMGTAAKQWLRFDSNGNASLGNNLVSKGTAAVLSGTGACATITTQVGGQFAGSAKCTGATGASTLTITFSLAAPNGYVCDVWDETTRANALQQTAHTTTSCTLTATSVTANDVFVFKGIGF